MSDRDLLPPSATPLMRASAQGRVSNIDVPISDLWDPQRCPADCLPFLAFAMSVDEWDPEWSIERQRQVIAESIPVHRIKGTPAAIHKALGAIGVSVDIVEWWQMVPRGPVYTHTITAYANDQDLYGDNQLASPRLAEIAARIIDSVRRWSQHYVFRLGVRLNQRPAVGAAGSALNVRREAAATRYTPPRLTSGLVAAMAGQGLTVARVSMRAV